MGVVMEAKSIERIAEELGVNFYDLHPYIVMRESSARREVVEFVEGNIPKTLSNYVGFWQRWQKTIVSSGEAMKMIDKNTDRLLINLNYYLRDIRSMARRKSYTPHELCKHIISDSTEALQEIKEFRSQ